MFRTMPSIRIYLLISFTFLIIIDADAQSISDQVIYLKKSDSYQFHRIQTGDPVIVRTVHIDSPLDEKVTGISFDTIFFMEGYVITRDIRELRTLHYDQLMNYDLQEWQLLIPPPEIYGSSLLRTSFETYLKTHKTVDYDQWYETVRDPEFGTRAYKTRMDQENIKKHYDSIHHWFVKLDLTRLLWLQIFSTIEWKPSDDFSLEMGAGFQFSDGGHFVIHGITGRYMVFPGNGFVLTLGPKFYKLIKGRPYTYFQPVLLYKYIWYDQMWTTDPANTGDQHFEDQQRNALGASVNFGTMKEYGKVILDISFGAGFKYTWITEIIYISYAYDHSYNKQYYDPPLIAESGRINAILNFSIKLGFGF